MGHSSLRKARPPSPACWPPSSSLPGFLRDASQRPLHLCCSLLSADSPVSLACHHGPLQAQFYALHAPPCPPPPLPRSLATAHFHALRTPKPVFVDWASSLDASPASSSVCSAVTQTAQELMPGCPRPRNSMPVALPLTETLPSANTSWAPTTCPSLC